MKKTLLSGFLVVAMTMISMTVKAQSDNGHEYVDLGLSVKWATCNIGATKPEEYGDFIAWGEIEPKGEYTFFSYFDTADLGRTFRYYQFGVNGHQKLDPEDDAAHERWGKNWRLPTSKEQDELRMKCTWKWTQINDVNGYEVTGPNGNSIFLPAAGYRYDNMYYWEEGNVGFYWSNDLYYNFHNNPIAAICLKFNPKGVAWEIKARCCGYSIRPVYSVKASKKKKR